MRHASFILSLCLFGASAWAATPAETTAAPPVAPVEEPAAETAAAETSKAVKPNDRYCLRQTGSRIPRKDKDGCLPVAGRSYDAEDLRSTGATTVAEALERLDPSIRRY